MTRLGQSVKTEQDLALHASSSGDLSQPLSSSSSMQASDAPGSACSDVSTRTSL